MGLAALTDFTNESVEQPTLALGPWLHLVQASRGEGAAAARHQAFSTIHFAV